MHRAKIKIKLSDSITNIGHCLQNLQRLFYDVYFAKRIQVNILYSNDYISQAQ